MATSILGRYIKEKPLNRFFITLFFKQEKSEQHLRASDLKNWLLLSFWVEFCYLKEPLFELPVVSIYFTNILAILILHNLERSTAIGKVINDYIAKKCELDDRAVHLLFSANRWELV